MHGVHQKTGIMVFAEINKNAVSCWNTRKGSLAASRVGQIAQDDVKLIYPSDLNVSFGVEEEENTFLGEPETGRKNLIIIFLSDFDFYLSTFCLFRSMRMICG
jgi:hypothetical protein